MKVRMRWHIFRKLIKKANVMFSWDSLAANSRTCKTKTKLNFRFSIEL